MKTESELIVLGAGVSGLRLASIAAQAGVDVLVLEARDRLGGRIHTIPCAQPVDAGASMVHGIFGNPLIPILDELGVKLGKGGFRPEGAQMFRTDGEPVANSAQILGAALQVLFGVSRETAQSGQMPSAETSLDDFVCGPDSPFNDLLEDEPSRAAAKAMARAFNGWTGADIDKVRYERDFSSRWIADRVSLHRIVSGIGVLNGRLWVMMPSCRADTSV